MRAEATALPPAGGPRRPGRGVLGGLLLCLLVLLAYLPTLDNGFIWDDDSYVTQNPVLRDADGLARIWFPRETPQYYPLVFSSFWIECRLFGLEPRGYHVTNLLLHALNAWLVWRLFRALGVPGAWLLGALFAVHPVQVESVAWITERKNLLSATFYLAAALAYLRFDGAPGATGAGARARLGWYALSLLAFACALLSKTVTCSLPAALLLAHLYRRRRWSFAGVAPLIPMFVLGVGLGLLTIELERDHVGASGAEFSYSFVERSLIASRALLFYPWKLLLPTHLTFIYPRWQIDAADPAQYLPLVGVLALFGVGVGLWRRGVRGPLLALCFYAGTLFPALGFIDVYPHRFSFVADHFVYLASLGILALFAAAAARLGRRFARGRGAVAVMAGVLLLACVITSNRRTRVYRDAETVWLDTLAENPAAWMASNNMATLRMEEARAAPDLIRARELAREAERFATSALRFKPDHHPALGNQAAALAALGREAEARDVVERAIAIAPHLPHLRWQLGKLREELGDPAGAVEAYREALARAPRAPRPGLERSYRIELPLDLARALARSGRGSEGAPLYEGVLELEPGNVLALRELAELRQRAGDGPGARALLERWFESESTPEGRLAAAAQLVPLLVGDDSGAARDPARAVRLAESLCQESLRDDPRPLDLLAFAYAGSGRFDDAVRSATEAREVALRAGRHELVTRIEGRLAAYREGRLEPL